MKKVVRVTKKSTSDNQAPNHEALVLPRYGNLFGAMRNPGSKRSNLNQRFVTRRIVSGNGSKLFQKPGPL